MSTLEIKTPRVFVPLIGPARYKGAHGGRGSAKSHFFAESLIERIVLNPGTRAVGIREVQASIKESSKRLLEDKIISMGVSSMFEVQERQIKTHGDGLIIFRGMKNETAESIKSLEGYDVAWVEEAQTISQRSLDMLRPTIRKEHSELWFGWNPKTPSDPIDRLLRNNPPPGSAVVESNWRDNPFFPDVLRAEMEYDRGRDTDKYLHIWEGQYEKHSESRVFHNWRVEPFESPADAIFRFGADWGFSVDPTVLVRGYIEGDTLYVDYEAWKVGCEIDETPSLFAGTDEQDPPRWANPNGHDGLEGALKWKIMADSARPETISYMQKRGFKIQGARKGPGSVEEGVNFLKNYDIVVHPRCNHVADELAYYSYKRDPLTDEILPVLEDKKNHTIDALRYMVESVRRHKPVMVGAAPTLYTQ